MKCFIGSQKLQHIRIIGGRGQYKLPCIQLFILLQHSIYFQIFNIIAYFDIKLKVVKTTLFPL